jgi:hypothetical protein
LLKQTKKLFDILITAQINKGSIIQIALSWHQMNEVKNSNVVRITVKLRELYTRNRGKIGVMAEWHTHLTI